MEKRNWLWKKKSSEKSPGDTDSSGSISSHSERFSGEQETLKEYSNIFPQSPDISSKLAVPNGEANDGIKILTEKLSAALVNVGAKEDLVKQHAKVAEEAIAGWEKAENEVSILKQQLEAAVQQNVGLEVRVNHLDGALKECVRQLRQAKEEHDERIHEALAQKTNDWETTRLKLENEVIELQKQVQEAESEKPVGTDPSLPRKLELIEHENALLKRELVSLSEELEIRTIEMDLSTQAAEMASKQQLESIRKVARLEAECRRLQAGVRKSSLVNEHKSPAASSMSVESLTDSLSDNGERIKTLDVDVLKMSGINANVCDRSCSDSWASALIAELDQFKAEKTSKNLTSCSLNIDIMDDFLEMERLAALPEAKSKTCEVESEFVACQVNKAESLLRDELKTANQRIAEMEDNLQQIEAEKDSIACQSKNMENMLRAELDTMSQRVVVLEDQLEKIEAEKAELEISLIMITETFEVSKVQLTETEIRLEQLQKELTVVNESKELLENQLIGMEVETRTMSKEVNTLKLDVEKEKNISAEMASKCRELEDELIRRAQEAELQQAKSSDADLKVKQEDLVVAADKLAECQKTIASLGRQLKSLATLEDFLTDAPNVPRLHRGESPVPPVAGAEPWKLHSNETSLPKRGPSSELSAETSTPPVNGKNKELPASASSSSSSDASLNTFSSGKSKNGFGKLFSRSKSGVQLENHHQG